MRTKKDLVFNWKDIIIIIEFLIIVLGTFYSYAQFIESKNSQLARKNDLAIHYYDRLNSGTNEKIYLAIERKTPLMVENGGKFNDDQVDNYLGDLHDVGQDLYSDLLDGGKVCSNFSDFAIKTWDNSEIQGYLLKTRKEDLKYFLGFDDLYKYVKTCE